MQRLPWRPDEQLSEEARSKVESVLAQRNWKVDILLSYTRQIRYEPRGMFLPRVELSSHGSIHREAAGSARIQAVVQTLVLRPLSYGQEIGQKPRWTREYMYGRTVNSDVPWVLMS